MKAEAGGSQLEEKKVQGQHILLQPSVQLSNHALPQIHQKKAVEDIEQLKNLEAYSKHGKLRVPALARNASI